MSPETQKPPRILSVIAFVLFAPEKKRLSPKTIDVYNLCAKVFATDEQGCVWHCRLFQVETRGYDYRYRALDFEEKTETFEDSIKSLLFHTLDQGCARFAADPCGRIVLNLEKTSKSRIAKLAREYAETTCRDTIDARNACNEALYEEFHEEKAPSRGRR